MPAGLDGNPDPITSPERDAVLTAVLHSIDRIDGPRVLVAVDGASSAGKSTFADELARSLVGAGHVVVRSTTDSFHRPRSERYRRGATSGEGYYLDSHDLPTIEAALLSPFRAGAPRVQVASFDEPTDAAAIAHVDVEERAVLIFDGLFLHRPELRRHWHLSVFLQADQRRAAAWDTYLHSDLPTEGAARAAEIDRRLERARWPRYHDGWQLYLTDADPAQVADIVIDNDDFAVPRVVSTRAGQE